MLHVLVALGLMSAQACQAPTVSAIKPSRASVRQILAPASQGPSIAPMPSASIAAVSVASVSATPSSISTTGKDGLSDRVSKGIENIARLSFAQGRGVVGAQAPGLLRGASLGSPLNDATTNLLSNNGSGILLNNGGGLLSNNGGGLISNNGGGLLSNNGGGLISNNGGGLVSGYASGYRLLQTQQVPSLVPLAGEFLLARREWLTGGTLLQFAKHKIPVRHYVRYVGKNGAGQALLEAQMETASYRTDGTAETVRFRREEWDRAGERRMFRTHVETYGDRERLLLAAFGPEPCTIRYPEAGVDVAIERYSLDLTRGTGQFRYRFGQLGFVEEGSMDEVRLDAQGRLYFSEFDALMAYDGKSTVTDGQGTVLFTKKRQMVAGRVEREYGLSAGLTIKLRADEQGIYRGVLEDTSSVLADVAMVMLYDGSTMFRLDYRGQSGEPQYIGFGEPAVAAPATPAPPVAYKIQTIAGTVATSQQETVTLQDGDAKTARFGELRALVASTKVKDRFYATDLLGNRIVRIERNGTTWQFITVAGNGEPGHVDGPGGQSRWLGPLGLAIGSDDVLYVSDFGNECIRRVRFQDDAAIVDTIAGSGRTGYLDGVGKTAAFNSVTSLAVSDDTLFVADSGNQRIRRVDLKTGDFLVSTLAGNGNPGAQDGDATKASFETPGTLLLRDGRYLLIAETAANRLRQLDLVEASVSTLIAGKEAPIFWYDGPTASGGVERPLVLYDAGARGLWTGQTQLRAHLPSGQLRTVAGRTDTGYQDGLQDEAAFMGITGIAPLSDGSWLLTDLTRVRRLIPPQNQ
jgi:sugar lactone lactonase YvrE